MLRLLLLLSAAALAAGTQQQVLTESTTIKLLTCPIQYFGVLYKEVYVGLSETRTTLCFDGPFQPAAIGDCIVAPTVSGTKVLFMALPGVRDDLDGLIKSQISKIKGTMSCVNYFRFTFFGAHGDMFLSTYGSQAAVFFQTTPSQTLVIDIYSMKTRYHRWILRSGARRWRVTDLSYCRHQGTIMEYSKESTFPDTCTKATCGETAEITLETCPKTKTCDGKNKCVSDLTCTISGSTVTTVNGGSFSISDRCVYQLLKSSLHPDVELQVEFQDRRRQDVSFVKNVSLTTGNEAHRFNLEQGGRLLVDGSLVKLGSDPKTLHNVKFSRDQTGISAELSLAGRKSVVFFDGVTVLVNIKGGPGAVPSLQGLCGHTKGSLDDLRRLGVSDSSCQEQHSQTKNPSINCKAASEHCAVLNSPTFKACADHLKTKPYIDACKTTLCKYPDVDGLKWRFLEVFAKHCSLHDIELGDWRTAVGCPSPQIFCQDRTCSDHEFCGEKTPGGDTRCFCRPVFASKFKNTLGDPATCSQDSGRVSVTLVGCLLEEKGVDASTLHLNDNSCVGQMDDSTHNVTFSFDKAKPCGAEITTAGNQVILTNTVRQQSVSSDLITRLHQVNINFSCTLKAPELPTMSFKIKDSAVIQTIKSGDWNYKLTMKSYSDAARSQDVKSDTELELNQKIWVVLSTEGLEESTVSLVTDSCWATKEQTSSSDVRHWLISNGCADAQDKTVEVVGNGQGTSNFFSFNLFEFTGNSGDVYLHCKVELCTSNCKPECGGGKGGKGGNRRRRSSRSKSEGEAFISMVWTN